MIDTITELIARRAKRGFLANTITLRCSACGLLEKSTYYELLKNQHFEILRPMTVSNQYIRESYYEEEIVATPIKFSMQCPHCGGQMETFSPVPLEYILNILKSPPTDDIMYG